LTSTILITGVAGGIGRHLAPCLRRQRTGPLVGLGRGPIFQGSLDRYFPCDLTDVARVRDVVREIAPDLVFHLAALNSFAPVQDLERVNVGGFVNLTAALRGLGKPVRLVTVGSAAEIGSVGAARSPVAESVACLPESPYGRSKWRVTGLALGEPAGSPLEVLVARPFNLLGPGLDPHLAFGSFAEQFAAVARGQAHVVRCGRLDTRRDFIDVRDAVRALVLLSERGRRGELYHVCAGRSWSIGELLVKMMKLSGQRVPFEWDPLRSTAVDVQDIYGDPTRLHLATGWTPEIPPADSLADMLASVGFNRRAA
jgi:nucleoside-diphosphate-sugar epimerase